MRTLAGIILIAFALSTLAFADQGNSSLPQHREKQFTYNTDRPTARTFNSDRGVFTADGVPEFQYDDNVCYTMHTLVVAREKGSDSTRLVRQQTCTPSDRFRVNHSLKPPRVVR